MLMISGLFFLVILLLDVEGQNQIYLWWRAHNSSNDSLIQVNETRNGPIDWNSLNELNTVTTKRSEMIVQPNELAAVLQEPALVDLEDRSMTIEKKPSLNAYKSAETLPSVNAI